MTEKEFRKLNKRDLLEMLIFQTKRADDLQASLDEANNQLESREIMFTNAGSLAEASIRLNGVFEAADAAIEQYLSSLGADGAAYTPQIVSDDASQMQAYIAETEARLKMRETEIQQREAACAERERVLSAAGYNAVSPVQGFSAVLPRAAVSPGAVPPVPDTSALTKELDERKTALDEREKAITEREFYCSHALENFAIREQNIAQKEAAVLGREAECSAREAAYAEREMHIAQLSGNVNNYIFALCERMKQVTADCDDIKQLATSFADGNASAAAPDAGNPCNPPEDSGDFLI